MAELGECLDLARETGRLPDPAVPVDDVSDINQVNSLSYRLAIRTRLVDLAYLPESERDPPAVEGAAADPVLSAAIRAFQRDAGFAGADVDGWAGPETFARLRALVGFEDGQDPAHWPGLGDPQQALHWPALARAVGLRLRVYGFWPDDTAFPTAVGDFEDAGRPAARALAEFSGQVLVPLFGQAAAVQGGLDLRLLRFIYGHDALVQALSEDDAAWQGTAAVPGHFVDALARVELWLLGFDLSLQAAPPRISLTPIGAGPQHHRRRVVVPVTDLADAVTDFWQQQTPPATTVRAVSGKPDRALFRAFAALLAPDATDPVITEHQADLAAQQALAGLSATARKALDERIADLASSVWDGIRRVLHWLRRGVAGLFDQARNGIKNLARYIARRARESFRMVAHAIDVAHVAFGSVLTRLSRHSVAGQFALGFRADADAQCCLDPDADAAVVDVILVRERQDTQALATACRLIGTLDALFKAVLTLGAGISNPLAAMIALARLYQTLLALRQELKALSAIEVPASASLFRNAVMGVPPALRAAASAR